MLTIEPKHFRYAWDNFKYFYLADVAARITGIDDITVKFTENIPSGNAAFVDILQMTIYLPVTDRADQSDQDFFRRTKALLYHECAHLMFPDFSDSYFKHAGQKEGVVLNLSRIIDDLRIEILLGNVYTDIRKDFKFLIDSIWLENYAIPPFSDAEMGNGRFGDFSENLFGSLYWILQKRYRNASLDPPSACKKILPFLPVYGIEMLFDKEIAPLLDPFVESRDPAWVMAVKILDVLMKYYPHYFNCLN